MPPDILIVYPMTSHMIFEESGDWPEGVHFRQFLSFYFRQLSDFPHFTTCESAGTPSHPAGHLRFGAPLQFAQCSSLLFAPQTARLTVESL